VEPDSVDEEFSADLLVALEADRLHASPRIVHQNAVRAWNFLAASISDWPKNRLKQPTYRKKKSPDACMHPRLSAAIESFLVRHTAADVFDLSAPMEAWKPSTVETYRRYLKRYFGLLVLLGYAPEDLTSLSDLVPIEGAKAALNRMMEQNDGSSRIGASHIARLLSQVARDAALQEPSMSAEKQEELAACAASLRELADRLRTNATRYWERRTEGDCGRCGMGPIWRACFSCPLQWPKRWSMSRRPLPGKRCACNGRLRS
jgi:hypothetical protein